MRTPIETFEGQNGYQLAVGIEDDRNSFLARRQPLVTLEAAAEAFAWTTEWKPPIARRLGRTMVHAANQAEGVSDESRAEALEAILGELLAAEFEDGEGYVRDIADCLPKALIERVRALVGLVPA